MSLETKKSDKRLVKEIIIILIIKVTILMLIKNIWFNSPTFPKNFDNQVAERIAGTPYPIKETR
ncbi:cytochrome oxidase putative small subunit CydP [Acinetobacter sp. MB5]|uniref:cytochrome oxidase putative small subunit CydP n=1 Tax=Acinetobacter sp. MB5 TaxID=2069438 RepID=UPI000DCFDC4C|nr:cytochrome oxidase putative small subunit CydP [Acinetobacter sp. MB5]